MDMAFEKHCGKREILETIVLTLYSIDTHFDTSTTDSFLKNCGKRRYCS